VRLLFVIAITHIDRAVSALFLAAMHQEISEMILIAIISRDVTITAAVR